VSTSSSRARQCPCHVSQPAGSSLDRDASGLVIL
jgi:hypothetical protein